MKLFVGVLADGVIFVSVLANGHVDESDSCSSESKNADWQSGGIDVGYFREFVYGGMNSVMWC